MIRRSLRYSLSLLMLVLVVLALSLMSLRLLLPHWAGLASQIEDRVGAQMDRQVRLGSLSLGWSGWAPELVANEVWIAPSEGQPEDHRLEARQLGVRLAPLRSLRLRAPVLGGARLRGITLRVERDLDGVWDVHGWRFGGGPSLALDWTRHFAGMDRLHIEDATVQWRDAAHDLEAEVQVDSVILRSDRTGLRLVGRGRLQPEAGGAIDLGIEVPPSGPDRLDFFLDARDLQLPYWAGLGRRLSGDWTGTSSVRVWGHMEDGRVRHLQGDHQTRLLVPDRAGWQVHPVGHAFQWRRDATRAVSYWRAATPGSGDLSLEYRLSDATGRGVDRITLGATQLNLEHYPRVIAGLFPDHLPEIERLSASDASGILETLELELIQVDSDWQVATATAQFRNLAFRAFGTLPGLAGLDARLQWQQDAGTLALDSHGLAVAMPTLFAGPLWVDRLEAQIAIRQNGRQNGSAWTLEVQDARVENADAAVVGRGRIDLTAQPHLDLALRFLRGDAARITPYLPVHILPAKTYEWLAEGIRAGRVTEGGLVFHGRPADFPFRHAQGVFDAWAVIEDGVLAYQPDWPEAQAVFGTLRFRNAGLRADGVTGRMLGSTVHDTTVVVADMLDTPSLVIDGRATGPLDDLPEYLRQAGLGDGFASYRDGPKPGGQSDLSLNLTIPLQQGRTEETRIAGRLAIHGARLEFPEVPLTLEAISGAVAFDPERGIRADGIEARLHDERVHLDLRRAFDGARTRVWARGYQSLAPWLEAAPALRDSMQGRAHWEAELLLGDTDADSRLELRSDLEGVQLDWPQPLAKTRGTRRPVQISWPLRHPAPAEAHVRFANVLAADFRLVPPVEGGRANIEALALHLGPIPAETLTLPASGIDLTARLDTIDADAWLAMWDPLRTDAEPLAGGLPLSRVAIEAVTAWRWGGQVFPGAHLRLDPESEDTPILGRGLHVEADWLRGTARRIAAASSDKPYPENSSTNGPHTNGAHRGGQAPDAERAGHGHWLVDLEHLHLKRWPDRPPAARSPRGDDDRAQERADDRVGVHGRFADPRAWPGVDLRLADLRLGEVHLTDLDLKLVPSPAGLTLQHLRLQGPAALGGTGSGTGLRIDGEGHWAWSSEGILETHVSAQASGDDWGRNLALMGISEALEAGSGEARIQASWPGAPLASGLAAVRGRVEIDLTDGRLRDVDPGAGRLLGLVSLDLIPRRLRLDFRDVYTQGLAFDDITGHARLEDGMLHVPELRIRGPSAVVRVSGRTGLVTRDYDQTIVVVPRLRSTLPIVGALLGGPVTGAIVLLVERALGIGDQVEEAARVEYFVTGPWSDPEIRARVRTPQEVSD